VRCTRKRTLTNPIDDLFKAMLVMVKQVPQTKSGLEIESSNADSVAVLTFQALTHSVLEAIATMAQVRVKDLFPCKQMRRAPLRANPLTGVMLLASAVSSMETNGVGFDYQNLWNAASRSVLRDVSA